MDTLPNSLPSAQELIHGWISWAEQQKDNGVELVHWGKLAHWPLIALIAGDRRKEGPVVYVSTGIHGDEPAGPMALHEWLRENVHNLHGTWILVPLLNPSGWDAHTRENADGVDLNRDYGNPETQEVSQHQDWLQTLPPIDLFLSLHEDYESSGFYLYCLNNPNLGHHILSAVAQVIPVQEGREADGKPLHNGLILTGDPEKILKEMPSWPEALWFYKQFPHALNITTETPSTAFPLHQRISAQKAVLCTLGLHIGSIQAQS